MLGKAARHWSGGGVRCGRFGDLPESVVVRKSAGALLRIPPGIREPR